LLWLHTKLYLSKAELKFKKLSAQPYINPVKQFANLKIIAHGSLMFFKKLFIVVLGAKPRVSHIRQASIPLLSYTLAVCFCLFNLQGKVWINLSSFRVGLCIQILQNLKEKFSLSEITGKWQNFWTSSRWQQGIRTGLEEGRAT
jgi:hypothetical protein